ncbi:MAG: hypothetical protein ACTSWZ_07655 [Candidatus Heimdallarchaeaceae archaeon]
MMEISELKTKFIEGNSFYRFSFGKYEIHSGLPHLERKLNTILRKNKIIPFAKERCGVVEHVYFYGDRNKINNVCKQILTERAFSEDLKDVILCGKVIRDEIGSLGCYPVELTE